MMVVSKLKKRAMSRHVSRGSFFRLGSSARMDSSAQSVRKREGEREGEGERLRPSEAGKIGEIEYLWAVAATLSSLTLCSALTL